VNGQAVSPVRRAGAKRQVEQWLLMRWTYLPLAT
jgi:hypothetical protein